MRIQAPRHARPSGAPELGPPAWHQTGHSEFDLHYSWDEVSQGSRLADSALDTIDGAIAQNNNDFISAEAGSTRPHSTQEPGRWIDSDTLPQLRAVRCAGELAAKGILEDRMQQLRDGEFDQVPEFVDPLTTAARVIEAETLYGQEGQEYRDAFRSLVVDCSRLFGEAERKNTCEYFPEIEQHYDEWSGGYHFKGRQLLDMVRDGITPFAEHEEEQGYRIGEYVEEVTYGAIRRLGRAALAGAVERPGVAAPELRASTISECADWAIEAYAKNSQETYGGYVPGIKKLMIRSVRYGSSGKSRYQEGMALPGTFYTEAVMNEAAQIFGMAKPGEQLTKAERRAKQIISMNGEGAIAITAVLDELASKASGKRIFMGEVIADNQPKDYAAIPAEATARQERLEEESEKLAHYLIGLEKSKIDHGAALGLVNHYVTKVLFEKVKQNPEQAAAIFDEQTSGTLIKAAQLRAQGYILEAELLELRAEQEAPAAVYCGAGSCGIVGVDISSGAGAEAKAKLGAESGDVVVRDGERSCTKCGKTGSVHYAYDPNNPNKKVKKACMGCGTTENAGKSNSQSNQGKKKSQYTLAA